MTNVSPTVCEITVQWDDSDPNQSFYLIWVWPTNQPTRPSEQTDFQQSNPDMTTATKTFTNLTPGTEYNIEIMRGTDVIPFARTVQRCRKFLFVFFLKLNATSNLCTLTHVCCMKCCIMQATVCETSQPCVKHLKYYFQ